MSHEELAQAGLLHGVHGGVHLVLTIPSGAPVVAALPGTIVGRPEWEVTGTPHAGGAGGTASSLNPAPIIVDASVLANIV